jgi:hypothetical protein
VATCFVHFFLAILWHQHQQLGIDQSGHGRPFHRGSGRCSTTLSAESNSSSGSSNTRARFDPIPLGLSATLGRILITFLPLIIHRPFQYSKKSCLKTLDFPSYRSRHSCLTTAVDLICLLLEDNLASRPAKEFCTTFALVARMASFPPPCHVTIRRMRGKFCTGAKLALVRFIDLDKL